MWEIDVVFFRELQDKVVNPGYCVGCGVCADGGGQINMSLNQYGEYVPYSNQLDVEVLACPFSDQFPNEDELSARFLPDAPHYERHIGRYIDMFAGHVAQGNYRKAGSSGGMASWIAARLLQEGHIDAVIHVDAGEGVSIGQAIFNYSISENVEQLSSKSKSRYYPVTLSAVLRKIKESDGRYAIIGLPCFIKAIRQLSISDKSLEGKILFHIGIVCGHLKTAKFADFLAWQTLGLPPKDYVIDFRAKLQHRPANSYGVMVEFKAKKYTAPMADLVGGDWGEGMFKLKACDFCDDVLAETADVVVGDAWLSNYRADYKGTNIIVSRNPIISGIIAEGLSNKSLCLDSITIDDVIASQSSGIRHRNEGLVYRLQKYRRNGVHVPAKRVTLSEVDVPVDRQRAYELREIIRDLSKSLYAHAERTGSLNGFIEQMSLLSRTYHGQHWYTRAAKKIIHWGKNVIRILTGTYVKRY